MTPQEQMDKWRKEEARGIDDICIKNGKICGKDERFVGEIKPCQYCGDIAEATFMKCDNCWQITSRIRGIKNITLAYKISEILIEKINELMEE